MKLQPQQHRIPHVTYAAGMAAGIRSPGLPSVLLLCSACYFPPVFAFQKPPKEVLRRAEEEKAEGLFSRSASLLALTKSNWCLGEAEKHWHEICVLGYLCSLRWCPDAYIPLTRDECGEEPYILLLQQLLLLRCHSALLNTWQSELRKQELDQLSWENMNKMFGVSFEFKNIIKKKKKDY